MKLSIAALLLFLSIFTASNIIPVSAEDYSVLVWTWQPTFCSQEKDCEDVYNQFTIHGLWPSSTSSDNVEYCSNEKFSSSNLSSKLTSQLNCEWPALGPTMSPDENYGFWSYEWKKHGTCSSLSQENYFSTAVNLSSRYDPDAVLADNSLINTSSATNVDLYDLKDMFTEAWGGITPMISCNDGTYLYEVWMCVDDNMQPMAKCPSSVKPRGCSSKEPLKIPTERTALSAPNCAKSSSNGSSGTTTTNTSNGTGDIIDSSTSGGAKVEYRLITSCITVLFAVCGLLLVVI